jgi:hypothetical protein
VRPPRLAPSILPAVVVVVAGALLAARAPSARAHHVVAEHGVAAVLPRTVVSLDAAGARYDVEGHRGTWQTLTPTVEWAFADRFSIFAALPLARLDGEGDGPVTGLGDLSLSAKAALYATPHGGLLLAAGIGAELPTGDDERNLGGGHVELAPFVAAASTFHEVEAAAFVAHALVVPRFALPGGDHHGGAAHTHGSFLAPHASRELFARVMTGVVLDRVHVTAGVEGASTYSFGGRGYLAPRAEVGVLLAPSWRAFAAVDLSVWGDERFGPRARLGLAWLL